MLRDIIPAPLSKELTTLIDSYSKELHEFIPLYFNEININTVVPDILNLFYEENDAYRILRLTFIFSETKYAQKLLEYPDKEIATKLYSYFLPLNQWTMKTMDLLIPPEGKEAKEKELKESKEIKEDKEISLIPAHLEHALKVKIALFQRNFEKAEELIHQSSVHLNFHGATLIDMSLDNISLNNINFCDANLDTIVCNHSTFIRACFVNANIHVVSFYDANLSYAYMSGVTFSGRADFSNANMTSVDLSGANLKGMNFSDAQLTKANFSNSNLCGVNFDSAILDHANFTGALLGCLRPLETGSDPQNMPSLLENAKSLRGANFRKAEYIDKTLFTSHIKKWAANLPMTHFLHPIARYSLEKSVTLSLQEKILILWLSGSDSLEEARHRAKQGLADFPKKSSLFSEPPLAKLLMNLAENSIPEKNHLSVL